MSSEISQLNTLNYVETSLAILKNANLEMLQQLVTDLDAEKFLNELYENRPQQFIDLHLQAIYLLANHLRRGESSFEQLYINTIIRLADKLIGVQNKFTELLESIDEGLLTQLENRQHIRYYVGLNMQIQGKLECSKSVYNELLEADNLTLKLRGRVLNSLAICCVELGIFEDAVKRYKQSITIWTELDTIIRVAHGEMNLGTTYRELQNFDEAKFYLTSALQKYIEVDADKDHWARIQNQLGLLEVDLGDWPAALAHYQMTLEHLRSLNSPDLDATVLLNMGRLDLLRGDFVKSRHKHQEVIQFPTNGIYQIESYLDLGLIAQIEGDFAEAETAYEQALEIAEEHKGILPRIYYQKAELLRRMEKSTEAIQCYEKAVEIIEESRGFIGRDEALKISLLGRWQQVYESLVLHCIQIGEPERAFKWAERARARSFAEALGPMDLSDQTAVELSDVQKVLLPDTAMLCYFTTGVLEQDIPMLPKLQESRILSTHLLTAPETILFVITQDDLQIHCLGDPNNFIFPLKSIEHIMNPAVSQGMYQILLGPLSKRNDYNQIYITPHGPLHHIPFSALLDPAGQPWLQEQGPALAYAPSPTLFVQHQRDLPNSEPIGNAYAIGYNGKNLRYAEAEAQRIAQITSGIAQVGSGLQKEQLQQEMAQYRLLHFSCHADFDIQEPMNSFLEIGPDQLLTAAEILREWHLPADLVTLSACQTGISKVLRSDEPMGLVRALLYAGCKAVLVTLWPVEDLPTLLFMEIFYQRLVENAGRNIPSALKDAQIRLRQLTMAEIRLITQSWDHVPQWEKDLDDALCPFENAKHWAAFVLIGS